MDVHRPRPAPVAAAPDALQQLPARVDTAGVGGQEREQAELLGTQVDLAEPRRSSWAARSSSSPSATGSVYPSAGRARARSSSQPRRPASSDPVVAVVSASSNPRVRAASRSATASGGARWTARSRARRFRSMMTRFRSSSPAGGWQQMTILGRSASRRSRKLWGSPVIRIAMPGTSSGRSRAGPSEASTSHAARSCSRSGSGEGDGRCGSGGVWATTSRRFPESRQRPVGRALNVASTLHGGSLRRRTAARPSRLRQTVGTRRRRSGRPLERGDARDAQRR